MYNHFCVEVGDQVIINPEYWDEDLIDPYFSNGPDHIYIVTYVKALANGTALVFLDGNDDRWENSLDLLLPIEQPPEFEISDDISSLFE